MSLVRRRLLYRGRVQGVGFRATTLQRSRGLEVAGFVRNLPEGSVEVVAEGTPEAIDAFASTIADALGRFIRDTSTDSQPIASLSFDGFQIRHD